MALRVSSFAEARIWNGTLRGWYTAAYTVAGGQLTVRWGSIPVFRPKPGGSGFSGHSAWMPDLGFRKISGQISWTRKRPAGSGMGCGPWQGRGRVCQSICRVSVIPVTLSVTMRKLAWSTRYLWLNESIVIPPKVNAGRWQAHWQSWEPRTLLKTTF